MKKCSGCKALKSEESFSKGQYWCKDCWRAYRQSHANEIRERNLKYMRANVEKVNEYNRKSYAKRRLVEMLRSRAKYERDKDKLRPVRRAWQKSNPEKCRASDNRRRALESGCKSTLTAEEWLENLETFNWRCAYCHGPLSPPTMDHVIPLVQGGEHTKENVVPSCLSCNQRKGHKNLLQYLGTLVTPPFSWPDYHPQPSG